MFCQAAEGRRNLIRLFPSLHYNWCTLKSAYQGFISAVFNFFIKIQWSTMLCDTADRNSRHRTIVNGAEPGSPVVIYHKMQRLYYMLLEVLRTASENRGAMGLAKDHSDTCLAILNTRSMKTAVVVCLVQWNIASEAIALSRYLFTIEYDTIFPLTNRQFSTWPHPPAPHWSCFSKLSFSLGFITHQVYHDKVNSLRSY